MGIAFAVLYLALAPPVPGGKDASEIALVLALAGAPHATGYPLFTLAGHAFVVLVHGLGASWAHAANAWSAAGGAVAMALHHALAARMPPPALRLGRGARFALALAATAVIGMNPVWVVDAMLAEVYSWHLAWVCAAVLVALGWVRALGGRPGAGEAGSRAPARLAAAWGLLCGLGLAHHVTAVLFIVPLSLVLVVALLRAGRWRASLAAAGMAAAVLPLASYVFILYRAHHPAAFQWWALEPAWSSVIGHVTGREYRDLLGRFAPSEVQRELFRTAIYPVLLPALAALLWSLQRARPGPERLVIAGLVAAAALQTAYGFSYGVADPSSYFQPAMAVGLLGVPLAGAALAGHRRWRWPAAALAGAGLLALGLVWIPLGFAVRSGTVMIERQVHGLWRSLPETAGIVLWRHDMLPALRGYQLLEGEKPALYVQDPYALTWRGPRRQFETRFGFDPLAGLEPVTAAKLALIPENVNRQTALPVYVFDPLQRTLSPLAKPLAASDSLGAGGR